MVDPVTPDELAGLRRDEAALPAGPWELWTSCSFRRITGPDGKDGGVLSAYNQRSDNHPDLSMPEDKLFALVRLRNALPALLDAAEREKRLEDALSEVKLTLSSPASQSARINGAFEVACQALGDRP